MISEGENSCMAALRWLQREKIVREKIAESNKEDMNGEKQELGLKPFLHLLKLLLNLIQKWI